MADIRIERTKAVQAGRPDSVAIFLMDDKGENKAVIEIYAKFEKPPFSDNFTVRIFKEGNGNFISPELDMKFIL